ncbi:MAG: nucleotidyltransferase domain-containing protein [Deltaproteobacteria bacterium]|nr:nucleotidyltransferase domain-containing protein [Deltaproteobacteria bacterium]
MAKNRYPKRIKKILDHLRQHKPERIYLFGSWARGEEDDLSDVDIVVCMESDDSFLDRTRNLMRTLPDDAGSIDLLVYTPEELHQMQIDGNAFIEMILEEGSLVYGRDQKE